MKSRKFSKFWFESKVLNTLALDYTLKDLIKLIQIITIKKNKNIPTEKFLISTKILSLEYRKDRRQNLIKRLDQDVNRYVLKSFAPNELLIDSLPEFFITKTSLKYLTKSSIACLISHINCWLKLLKDDVDTYLILEDDFILKDSSEFLFGKYANLPKGFDLVIFGNQFMNKIHVETKPNNGYFVPWICRRGSYSYAISKKGVKRLLEEIIPIDITFGGIDTLLGREIRKKNIKTFRSENDIFDVDKASPSDIINPDLPNKHIFEHNHNKLSHECRLRNTHRFLDKLSAIA